MNLFQLFAHNLLIMIQLPRSSAYRERILLSCGFENPGPHSNHSTHWNIQFSIWTCLINSASKGRPWGALRDQVSELTMSLWAMVHSPGWWGWWWWQGQHGHVLSNLCVRHCTMCFSHLNSFNPTTIQSTRHYDYSHFVNEEPKIKKALVTYPEPHIRNLDSDPDLSNSKA